MAKTDKNMVNTSNCENCEYGELDEKSKYEIYVYCKKNKKRHYYNQEIECKDVSSKKKQ